MLLGMVFLNWLTFVKVTCYIIQLEKPNQSSETVEETREFEFKTKAEIRYGYEDDNKEIDDFPAMLHLRFASDKKGKDLISINFHMHDLDSGSKTNGGRVKLFHGKEDDSEYFELSKIKFPNKVFRSHDRKHRLNVLKVNKRNFNVYGNLCLGRRNFIIQPAKPPRTDVNIMALSSRSHCGQVEESEREQSSDSETDEYYVRLKRSNDRNKRETSVLTVELLIVVDYSAYKWWDNLANNMGGGYAKTDALIKEHYDFIFKGMNDRLQNIDNTLTISVVLSGIHIAKTEEESFWTLSSILEIDSRSPRVMVNASEALEKFQIWLDTTTENIPHYDHAILFTGTNLSYAGSAGNTGLAFGSSMCLNISNSSIVEDLFDYRTVTFATQQIARSLGSRDDMDNNDCLEFFNYIMAPKFKLPLRSFASNRWKFSTCSKQYINEYVNELNTSGLNCLNDTPLQGNYYVQRQLQGFVHSAKRQCQQRLGPLSDVCRVRIGTGYSTICSGLLCSLPESDACEFILPADGTTCGNKKYCFQGNCDEFEDAKETSDTCAFGNDPLVECNQLVREDVSVCYNETVRYTCCKACETIAMNLTGCEFGDRSPACRIDECITGGNTYVSSKCCLTCLNGPTPYVPPIESLLDEVTTTPYNQGESSSVSTPVQILLSTQLLLTNPYASEPTLSDFQGTPTTSSFSPHNDAINATTYFTAFSDETSSDLRTSTPQSTESLNPGTRNSTSTLDEINKVNPETDIPPLPKTTTELFNPEAKYDGATDRIVTTVRHPENDVTIREKEPCVCPTNQAGCSTFAAQNSLRPNPVTPSTNKCISSKDGVGKDAIQRLFNDIANAMRKSQRNIRYEVHKDVNALYGSISNQLQKNRGEYENESEGYAEGSNFGSSDDENINRKLWPIWIKNYASLLQHLDRNVRDMRYKVLATFNREFKRG